MHPNLEPLVKGELNKLLVAKIIFHVRHTQWVENLVPSKEEEWRHQIVCGFQKPEQSISKGQLPCSSYGENFTMCFRV
jgi:hypothetical protein